MSFPDHPFWDYSLGLYSRPGVSAACLALQDEYGLDVNLLLFCIWSAVAGPGDLSMSDIKACIAVTRAWQERAVQPLRTVRRYSNQPESIGEDVLRRAFYKSIQKAELDAEHVEQLVLAALADSGQLGDTDNSRPAAVADQNLSHYLAVLQVERSDAVGAQLDIILAAAFRAASA